jgi:hypothetical protein
MPKATTHDQDATELIPSKGQRIEYLHPDSRACTRGTVHYADQLQILVKWDDGSSNSLRVETDHFRLIA